MTSGYAPAWTGTGALVPDRTSVRIYTFAEGLFAAFAHDLELRVEQLRGLAEYGPHSLVQMEAPVSGIRVAGVMRKGSVDTAVLTQSDRREINRKIQREVFRGMASLNIRADFDGQTARLMISQPSGSAVFPVENFSMREDKDLIGVSGESTLCLKTMCIREIGALLGAFRISNRVVVRFDAVFEKYSIAGHNK